MSTDTIDPAVAALHADHPAAAALGIELHEAHDGRAVCEMTLRPDMLNFFQTGHGGLIFTLADTTAGYACQSRGGRTVAQSGSIDFTAPARTGALLTATAHEHTRAGRNGYYDVTIADGEGTTIAIARFTAIWLSKPPKS